MKIEAQIDVAFTEKILDHLRLKHINWASLSSEEKCLAINKIQRGCQSCSISKCGGFSPVPSILNPGSKVVFIGRAPNETEAQENKLFGDSVQGKYFERYLSEMGLARSEVSVLNMAQCWSEGGYSLTIENWGRCSGFKKLEFDAIGDGYFLVVPLGDLALRWLFGDNCPGVKATVGKIYRVLLFGKFRYVVPMYHPSYMALQPELQGDISKVLTGVRTWLKQTGRLNEDIVHE